jgi:hypothetical protein
MVEGKNLTLKMLVLAFVMDEWVVSLMSSVMHFVLGLKMHTTFNIQSIQFLQIIRHTLPLLS